MARYRITKADVAKDVAVVIDVATGAESVLSRKDLIDAYKLGFRIDGMFPNGMIYGFTPVDQLNKALSDSLIITDNGMGKTEFITFWRNKLLEKSSKVVKVYNMTDNEFCLGSKPEDSTFNTMSLFQMMQKEVLDLSEFNTSKMTKMCGMFSGFNGEIKGLEEFDTSKVTDMRCMFCYCHTGVLDLRSFDVSNVKHMYGMFSGCRAKSVILNSDQTKIKEEAVKSGLNIIL